MSPAPERCQFCGSPSLVTVPGPHPGGHYAKLSCASCGRMAKWLPRPEAPGGGPAAEVLARVRPRPRPCPLRGTPAQVRFAASIRQTLLHQATRAGDRALRDLFACVTDATWFVANKGRPLSTLRWPSLRQVEDPAPTGACLHCGGEAFEGGAFCSAECGDEHAAGLISDRFHDIPY